MDNALKALPLLSRRKMLEVAAAAAAAPVTGQAATQDEWGTYLRPFSPQSPWNSRPVRPVFDDFEIPRSSYFPALVEGKYSTGVFPTTEADTAVLVRPLPGIPGLWDADAEVHRDGIVIPRWPASTLPATGSDGHADVVDIQAGIVHSFFQLKYLDGQWRARQYAWTRLDGRGWGDPGHYYQGARAAAVPSMGGIMRKHEVNDGDSVYRHALALSLTYNAMSAAPTYVFPATSADGDAARTNKGRIPEGALLMLPTEYDTTSIRNPKLRKVADTLKVFGGYVVDRNVGTPFTAYVEYGSNVKLHAGGWDNEVARELDRMRSGLRWVVETGGWLDALGRPMEMDRRLNLLSMRGPWRPERNGGRLGSFETWRQAVVFAAESEAGMQVNSSGRSLQPVAWARPVAGEKYRLTAQTTGGGRLRLQLFTQRRDEVFDSGELDDQKSVNFDWPADQKHVSLTARAGKSPQGSSVSGTLVALRA